MLVEITYEASGVYNNIIGNDWIGREERERERRGGKGREGKEWMKGRERMDRRRVRVEGDR